MKMSTRPSLHCIFIAPESDTEFNETSGVGEETALLHLT